MRAYFPLRSNAAGLLSTTSGALIRRIKLAALLGNVLLEDGSFTAQAGPDGSFEGWDPPDSPRCPQRVQTPRERAMYQRAHSYVAVGKDDGRMHPILDTPTSVHWQATFSPIKRGLNRGYSWITFGYLADSDVGSEARALVRLDREANVLKQEPLEHVRTRLIEHVARDTVVASRLDAVMVTDTRHGEVIRSRIANSRGSLAPAYLAAGLLNPDVDALSWDDIDELRKMPGWSDLRAIWTEVGELLLAHADSQSEIRYEVQRAYMDRVIEAAAQTEGPRSKSRIVWKILDLATGVVTNLAGLNPALSLGVDLTIAGAEEIVSRAGRPDLRWIAAHDALRNRTMERRAAEPLNL